MTRPTPPQPKHATSRRRLQRRHMLMLILAVEVLAVGAANADRYRRPGIVIEQTLTRGHVIT